MARFNDPYVQPGKPAPFSPVGGGAASYPPAPFNDGWAQTGADSFSATQQRTPPRMISPTWSRAASAYGGYGQMPQAWEENPSAQAAYGGYMRPNPLNRRRGW